MGLVRVSVSPPTERAVLAEFRKHALSWQVARGWMQDIVFDLHDHPNLGEQLQFVRDGGDSFHHVRRSCSFQGTRFEVYWEFDWIREDEQLVLLGVTIVEAVPKIPRNPQ